MKNIILIGMPSCGKTTTGKIISYTLGRAFYDTDELILARTGRTPRDIISTDGENAFRDIESDVINGLSELDGTVIATGGGAVLRRGNVTALQKNGVIVFIDRSPDLLCISPSRPLSDSREKLTELYRERRDIYLSCADITVNGDGSPDTVADAIMTALKGKL